MISRYAEGDEGDRTRRLPETGRMYAYHDVRHTRLLFFPFHRHG